MFILQVPEITRYVPELAPEPEYTGYPLETLDAKVNQMSNLLLIEM